MKKTGPEKGKIASGSSYRFNQNIAGFFQFQAWVGWQTSVGSGVDQWP
jgi:hypothetical protein